MEYAILVPHGAGSFRVSNVAERSKHRRIHAMHFVHSNRTGQPWVKPGHDDVDGSMPATVLVLWRARPRRLPKLRSFPAFAPPRGLPSCGYSPGTGLAGMSPGLVPVLARGIDDAAVGFEELVGDLKDRKHQPALGTPCY